MHYLAFDTETTGLGKDARIVELAVAFFTNGEVVETWESLFFPTKVDFNDPNVQKAFEINRIDPDSLANEPTFEEELGNIQKALTGEEIWVAHNTPFDLRMLSYEYEHAKRTMPKPQYALDTMMLDKAIDKYRKGRRTLDAVAPLWNVSFEGEAHRALTDAIVCGKVLWAMLRSGRMPPNLDAMYGLQVEARDEWDAFVAKKYQRNK